MYFNRFKWLLLLFLLIPVSISATHNRAGEISFEQIGPLTIRARITTYTKTSSISADRDSIEIFWGDGTSEFALRANGWGDPQANDVKINYYIAVHSYPARATYTISMFDPNRVAGILNVNYPDSESVPFYLETTFTFLNTQFQGENNSAVLLQPPLDYGCVGEVFIHNPNAYDIDGDSLHYSLTIPLQGKNAIVPDYKFPDQIDAGEDNQISIDGNTGNLIWDSPQIPGEYNIAINIEEYRNGVLINKMIRDMQVFILDNCQNEPPHIDVVEQLCVFAGDSVIVNIKVNDNDIGQKVNLLASGAPFISSLSKAVLEVAPGFNQPELSGRFFWTPTCEDISDQYYQIIFRAMDNSFNDTSGLATLRSLRIKVIAPPPENFDSHIVDEHNRLEWDYPYLCSFAEKKYFRGFSIWRRESSNLFVLDSCATGLEGRDYDKIEFLINANDAVFYYYDDYDIDVGKTYCYRVMPEFARISFDGFPYNQVSGQPSNETCISLPLALPYLSKVSVIDTDENFGSIQIEWKKPLLEYFDTLSYPGPYRYQLLRSRDGVNFENITEANFYSNYFSTFIDTGFLDVNLDTQNDTFYYGLDFYVAEDEIFLGSAIPASSVFLNLSPLDKSMRLRYNPVIPWVNSNYVIFRKGPNDISFDSIATTGFNEYLDEGLMNTQSYCYYVQTIGNYLFDKESLIINNSQQRCEIASDKLAPCIPELSVVNDCDTADLSTTDDDLFNLLIWSDPAEKCPDSDDVIAYRIYFSLDSNQLLPILDITDSEQISIEHNSEAGLFGCYAVTAIDSSGNESELSNIVCKVNCPVYELPNVFTPNADGHNDYFRPRYARHIRSVDMKIFNQWGQLVFETQDFRLNWDGTNRQGKGLAEGVYHYVCIVYEQHAEGLVPIGGKLSGYIHLIRGKR